MRLHCSLSYMINKFLHGERKLLSLCVWWYESIHEPSGIFVSQRLGRLQDNKLLPPLSQQYMKLHSMAWPRHFFSCICLRTHNGSHKLPVTSPLLKFIHCRHTNCGRWSYIILVVCSEHYIGVLRTLQWCAQNIPVVCSEHSSGVLSFHETVCSVFISVECQLSKHIGTEKYLDDWNIN